MIQYEKPSISVVNVTDVDIVTASLNDLVEGVNDKNTLPLWKDENQF